MAPEIRPDTPTTQNWLQAAASTARWVQHWAPCPGTPALTQPRPLQGEVKEGEKGAEGRSHSPTSDSLWVLMISANSKFPAMMATWKEREGRQLSGSEQHGSCACLHGDAIQTLLSMGGAGPTMVLPQLTPSAAPRWKFAPRTPGRAHGGGLCGKRVANSSETTTRLSSEPGSHKPSGQLGINLRSCR